MQLSTAQAALQTYLRSFPFFTEADIAMFSTIPYETRYLSKGEFYIREGAICKDTAFVVSGILRSYYTSENGKEFTYCISFPSNFTSAYSSFINGLPTEENIQAITNVALLVFRKEAIEQLALVHPKWVHFLRFFAEQQYIELEKRIFQLHKYDALERYRALLDQQPALLQQVPLQYLASYLGISQRHLSRIRKAFSF